MSAAIATAAPTLEEARDFIGTWEYRWGDSPRDAAGALVWAQPSDAGDTGWQSLGRQPIPSPPGRNGQRFLWLRSKLDGPRTAEPFLYIGPVNQLFEAFVDGKIVYRWGQIDGQGPAARRFAGYPMHFIPVGADYVGHTLTLRIYSQHIGIGIGSPQRIGSKAPIIAETLRKDLGKIIVGIVLCAVGLFVLGLYLTERREPAYLHYAIFAFTMGVWLLCQMRVRNFLVDAPLVWTHVEYFSLYVAAGFLGLFLLRVLGRGPLSLMPIVVSILLAYPALAALAVAIGILDIMRTLVVFEISILGLIVYMLIFVGIQLGRGNRDARLFAVGFGGAMLLSLYDVLSAISILPRPSTPLSPFGQGLFVLTLGLIMVLRFRRVHQDLVATQQTLSEKLGALEVRNTEIENLNAELRHQIEARSKQLATSLLDSSSSSSQEILPIFSEGALISDRYRVVRMIGQGAMGVVYEVERLHDGRRFAAKVLSSRARNKELARFAREAQLLARLKHENLVSIADVDVTGNRLAYIIMELVDGNTLEDSTSRYTDLPFALPVLRQLADALATVHDEGVVHRDLKPANILVARTAAGGEPMIKVVDFGVSALRAGFGDSRAPSTEASPRQKKTARELPAIGAAPEKAEAAAAIENPPTKQTVVTAGRAARSENLTQTGVIMGTPLYMAPELIRGARLATPASDMWSFGIIAFELLTGQLPSETPPMLLPLKPLTRWHTALALLCPALPEHIGDILERCLDAAPENRPTAVEVGAALKQWTPTRGK